jgi:hypothetical protein
LSEERLLLAELEQLLAARVGGLRVERRTGDRIVSRYFRFGPGAEALAVTTAVLPGGLAQVLPAWLQEGIAGSGQDWVRGSARLGFELSIFEPRSPDHAIEDSLVELIRTPDAHRVVDAILEWATYPLRTGAPSPRDALTRTRAAVAAALADASNPPPWSSEPPAGLCSARVAFHYPRDRRGRLRTTTRALLQVLEPSGTVRGRERCRFVTLKGGSFRTVESEEFVAYQEHRWHQQTWRWGDGPLPPAADRWGVADAGRAREAAALLEAGEFTAGLALFDVALSQPLLQVIEGRPMGLHLAQFAVRWANTAAEELAGVAPWRLRPLTGRKPVRLFGLGGITSIQKPSVVLTADAGATLDFDYTGSLQRPAREDWQRSLDFEAIRLGLATEGALV